MINRAPSLRILAMRIEHLFPDLVAIVYPANHPRGGFCNTDRKIPGTRLRRPGKGRRGSRLMVSWRPGHGPGAACRESAVGKHSYGIGPHCMNCGEHRDDLVFEHNAAETYRTNADVVRWIEQRKAGK